MGIKHKRHASQTAYGRLPGHADTLRPAASVASGATAMALALLFAVGFLSDVGLGRILNAITMLVAWVSVAMGFIKLIACLSPRRRADPPIADERLPNYTVLLPLFREAHMVDGLVQSLGALDYPTDRLDMILICEADDRATIDAARRAAKAPFRLMIVPPVTPGGEPQTKPRALNYALARSSGDLVTIFDAEDRPHPTQLKAAANAFASHPNWAALQAPLLYFNTTDSPLAAQFGLEYAGLFTVLLPFYDRAGLPFPLGGTSNHMRRDDLEAVGGWDAYNVTEDADLAFRLAALGRHIGWIAPPTREEAVSRARPWMRQRSRWIKGYLQTWLVHMNTPLSGGWRRVLMLQLTLGLSLMSVLFYAPVILYLSLYLIASWIGIIDSPMPSLYLSALVFSLASGMAVGALGAVRAGQTRLLNHVPFMPLYWLMLFPPLMVALYELRTRPFHWHKTEHGVTAAPPESAG